MKPKARKFRIKRPGAPAPERSARDTGTGAAPQESGNAMHDASAPQQGMARESRPPAGEPARPAPPAQRGQVDSSRQVSAETGIEAIRREGLTGRQLRMARRVAQKHGLAPTSDFDAVRLLRASGIDPFQRSNMLELVVPDNDGLAKADAAVPAQAPDNSKAIGRIALPQTVPAGGQNLPSSEAMNPAERRDREISQIQKEITNRRRKKSVLLMTRLSFFVILPTFLAGWYFYILATPMFATNSEFLIIQSEGSGGAGPLGGLLPTQFATSQDAIAVQSYLTSKDAMLRLDADVGFKSHFSQDWVDPIQRLGENSSNEDAYKIFKKNVKIGFDPTEGVIRMEVVAAAPEVSQSFSEKLISYAEKRVNDLSDQKRQDQMRDAIEAVEKAEFDRVAAQEDLVRLQIEGSTLDPQGVIQGLRGQVTELEVLITQKRIELATLLNNARPNRAKVDGARSGIEILESQLAELNDRMTDMSRGANSLAELAVRIQLAQADLATRDLMLQSALQQREQAQTEANRQVRYLTVAVNPVAPDEAAYPRAFENTILAFLIFAGIYLMISLTASILREQVSS